MRTPDFTNLDDNSLRVALGHFVFRSRIARVSIRVVFVASLLFGLASASLAQESCATEGEVTIAYKGIMCAFYPYTITLNGTEAHGPGDSCVMVSASTPKTYTKLKLNKTYKMTAGSAICVTTINFQVPEGYTLYVDGKESNQIYKSDALNHVFSGDGQWDIVVRKNCDCGPNKISHAASKRGSVLWQSGMGMLSDGRSAYGLRVAEKTLSAAIYTPATLVYSAPGLTSEVDVVTGGDGNLRQVKAPQGLADIVVVNASEYDIRYYRPTDVGAKTNGIYTVSGQPFVTWKFKNPDTSSITKLWIQKIENGIEVDRSEYVWEPITDAWTLSTGWTPGTGTYSRIDSSVVSHPTTNLRTVINTVKDGAGKIASKTAKTYQTFPWGEELVQEIQDPEVSVLTTTYDFYTDLADESSYSQLKSIKLSDGSWEKYEYNDVDWTISRILRPWKDLTLESATPQNSRATLYQYAPHDGYQFYPYYKYISGIQEQIQGVVVRNQTFTRWSADNGVPITINGQPVVLEEQRDYASATLSQATTTTRYYQTASLLFANRIAEVEFTDGRKDTYTYEKGTYVPNIDPSLSQFTPNVNGLSERQIVTHGTTTSPNGVAFKTTKEITVRDQRGNEVLQETFVFNGADYERIGWVAMDYDDRAHLVTSRNNSGEVATAVWIGDQKTSEIDTTGFESLYNYDALGRVSTQTKKGIAASGGFPAQNDIVNTFTYDAEGHKTSERTSGEGISLTTTRAYDKAGRVMQETDRGGFSTDAEGLTTTYNYSNGGRTLTRTRRGSATEITEKYLDGQPKSTTGSAVVAQYFDYGVNSDGSHWRQEFVGSGGLSSPRWTKTGFDWINRSITVEKPSFTGVNTTESSTYNSLGQLQKQAITINANKIIADRLYEYDELGEQVRSGSDLDSSNTLTLSSTDRLTENDVKYEKVGTDWFLVTSTKTYLVDNSDIPVTRTRLERLNNFPLNGSDQTISELTVTDVAGNVTRTITTIDRAAKKRIETTDTPDSNLNSISVSVNGLLQSTVATTPQSATTYTYDSLGRETSVTDPRSGTSTRSYNLAGQLESTNDGAGTTTYEYYSGSHLNAGFVKTQTNASGKKTYFSYNSRGDLIQTWGDTAYPVENVYDNYGQRTESHTFRGGQNWAANVWPASTTGTADVTKWIYQESTGLITQKLDATLKGAVYSYDELDRMKTRVWARGVTSTYSYDANTGELGAITYSDSTPAVIFTYDRGGRQSVIADAAGTHTRTFNVAGEMETEQITGGILDGLQLTIGYDGFLRRSTMQMSHGANTLLTQTYGYDATSRLQTVAAGERSATYTYYPASGLLNTTTFTGGTNIARTYDAIGRMESITTTPASDGTQGYNYLYNNLNQRTRLTRDDGSYWSYTYNDRGEVATGKKYWSDNSIVWGAQTEYTFDNIGNRKIAKNGGNQSGNLRQSSYTTNSLNQYSQRTVPGAIDVTGVANTSATVVVNNQIAARKGEYFYKEVATDNTGGPTYAQLNVVGARTNFGAGGEDAVTEKGGNVFVPPATEATAYDFDGNLVTDGRWTYTWNAENRLIAMETLATVPASAKARLEFVYDYMGRRVRKQSYRWNVTTSSYEPLTTTRFMYDKWNLGVELDPSNALVRNCIWGTGQVLFMNAGSNSYVVGYDGNENVNGLINADTGKIAATYEYDPFGQIIKSTGDYAASNPLRFSNHYTDIESDLVYYGLRYYNPNTGRWLSRDPIEERGGINLYALTANNPVNLVDILGLQAKKRSQKSKPPEKCKCCCVDDLDVVTSGNFQGNLSLTDYFPYLSGQKEFLSSNPGVAGPFEDRGSSGTRIGAKVQIVSKLESNNTGDYCNFSQHYWVGSEVVGGSLRNKRGVVIDDIAASGQIQSQAPFRQYIDGNPSIADPPSVESWYPTNVQFWFTTCLSSGGDSINKNCKKKQCCVKWVVMIRINGNAKVTQHTVYRESKWCW